MGVDKIYEEFIIIIKMLKFLIKLRSLDRLGHKFSLNYEGNNTYQTMLGTLLTIATAGLVGILFLN